MFSGIQNFIEKPLDPLTPEKAEELKSLEDMIDGLHMHPDRKSSIEKSEPEMLYAMYNGQWLGSCYGSRFEESHNAHSNPDHTRVTSMIHKVYKEEKTELKRPVTYRDLPEDKEN